MPETYPVVQNWDSCRVAQDSVQMRHPVAQATPKDLQLPQAPSFPLPSGHAHRYSRGPGPCEFSREILGS